MKYISCFFIFLLSALSYQAQAQQNPKPNIIFILVDDMGYGDVGVFFQNQRAGIHDQSKPFLQTPHLDKMAQLGAMLPQHYCAAPVCAPSRASLLLGQNQGNANVRDNQFDKAIADNYTLGNVMQKAGYTTALIGKWGLQGDKDWSAHPLKRGFDYYYGYMRHSDGHEHYPKEGIYRGRKEMYENYAEVSKDLDKCYTGDLWTARTKKWIIDYEENKKNDKPFFMFLAFDTPHAVFELPTCPYPSGSGLDGGMQWFGVGGKMINTAIGKPDSWIHPAYVNATYDDDHNQDTPEQPWPETYKRFATSIRRIDDQVGDILDLLQDLKIDSNTMVVFSSDNGPTIESYLPKPNVRYEANFFNNFGPFDGIKRDVLEGGLRTPLIVKWTGHIPAGTVMNSPSISYDWMPTFLDAAHLPAPAISDGVSILPSLLGKPRQYASLIYTEYAVAGKTPDYSTFTEKNRGRTRNQMQMIRMKNIVGVRYNIKSHQDDFELYEISKDSQQQDNLALKKNTKKIQQNLKDKVLQLRRADPDAPRPYDNEAIPAIKTHCKKGLLWTTYFSNTIWLPNISLLKPISHGKSTAFNPVITRQDKANVIVFDGLIKVPADGSYTFHFSGGGKALFRIHDAILIDADFNYSKGQEKHRTVKLKKGLHPIKMYFEQQTIVDGKMYFDWSGPAFDRQAVPSSSLFH